MRDQRHDDPGGGASDLEPVDLPRQELDGHGVVGGRVHDVGLKTWAPAQERGVKVLRRGRRKAGAEAVPVGAAAGPSAQGRILIDGNVEPGRQTRSEPAKEAERFLESGRGAGGLGAASRFEQAQRQGVQRRAGGNRVPAIPHGGRQAAHFPRRT